ncbi:hypothetical protein SAMN02745248_00361 [Hathewaya proteolytica DSM 3090]|uniref:DUF5667 domain-containing protein n=1 Tax=Hathewaya proteolytica DSM 3090 TaxID=1121331 RepID=A0A1M6K7C3_9CLOT|nr:DUF5667 domain-containing protein [Hathewaya proteolytica]SHJ54845.1 hypothetical protein SAMN02745248_00361 [Hathewaya proteolytica DSM 3090]
MKKTSILVTTVMLLTIGFSKVAYATEQKNAEDKAGVVPGSIFYKLDRFIEDISLNLTKNAEKKAALIEAFNEERLAEGEVLIADYKIDEANELIEEIRVNDEKLIEIISSEEEIESLDYTEKQKQFMQNLENIKELLPIKAQENIAKVIEKQKEKQALILSKREIKEKIHVAKKEIKSIEKEIRTMEKQGQDTVDVKNKLQQYKESMLTLEVQYKSLKEEHKKSPKDEKDKTKENKEREQSKEDKEDSYDEAHEDNKGEEDNKDNDDAEEEKNTHVSQEHNSNVKISNELKVNEKANEKPRNNKSSIEETNHKEKVHIKDKKNK